MNFYQFHVTVGASLFASAGITRALSHVFEGGVLCSLPELFFDSALLWTFFGRPNRETLPPNTPGIPSWSWAGWSYMCYYLSSWQRGLDAKIERKDGCEVRDNEC
jgi:hypothetical protein